MTNWDKAKEMMDIEDVKNFKSPFCKAIYKLQGKEYCYCDCTKCYNWLKQGYKEPILTEPILTESERKYLSAVIKPFQEYVMSIEKCHDYLKGTNKIYIQITLADDTVNNLPIFDACDMKFQNMQFDMRYTTIDLGI